MTCKVYFCLNISISIFLLVCQQQSHISINIIQQLINSNVKQLFNFGMQICLLCLLGHQVQGWSRGGAPVFFFLLIVNFCTIHIAQIHMNRPHRGQVGIFPTQCRSTPSISSVVKGRAVVQLIVSPCTHLNHAFHIMQSVLQVVHLI